MGVFNWLKAEPALNQNCEQIMDSSPAGFIITDTQFDITYVNQAAIKLLQAGQASKLVGNNLAQLGMNLQSLSQGTGGTATVQIDGLMLEV